MEIDWVTYEVSYKLDNPVCILKYRQICGQNRANKTVLKIEN